MSEDQDISEEFRANLLDRLAYGEAARLVARRGRTFAFGVDRVREVALEARALARDIAGRLGVAPAAIVEAEADAPAGREPRR